MSFFFKIFGSRSKAAPVLLAFYDDFVQVAQVTRRGNGFRLLAFNEMPFNDDVFHGGEILNSTSFETLIKKLLAGSQPNPIKTSEVFANLPFNMLFPFARDISSRISDKQRSKIMMDYIASHSPLDLKDFSFSFSQHQTNAALTYGAVATPIRWEDRFKKVFRSIGISTIHFIPEPQAMMALIPEKPNGDFITLVFHEGGVFTSVFHNALLYDTFILNPGNDPENPNCRGCIDELKKTAENFRAEFEKDLHQLYFINFHDAFAEKIKSTLPENDFTGVFLNKNDLPFSRLFPTSSDFSVLAGLAKKVLEKN